MRYDLINHNKTSRYLKYAIGEIILVVVGILIALQINNWNSNRLLRLQEQLVLKELNKEFKANKLLLDSVIFYHKRSFKSAEYVRQQIPIKVEEVNLDSLSYNLYYMGWIYTFDPYTGVTNNVLNNSSLELISNDSLRQLLVGWKDILEDYQEEEIKAINNYQNHLKPFEKKHFFFSYNPTEWLNYPKVDLKILESLEFDNYIMDRHNDINEILNNSAGEIDMVISNINKIIELTETD